ncbi:unnamed protein product, partial [Citrullus colocynthis]
MVEQLRGSSFLHSATTLHAASFWLMNAPYKGLICSSLAAQRRIKPSFHTKTHLPSSFFLARNIRHKPTLETHPSTTSSKTHPSAYSSNM